MADYPSKFETREEYEKYVTDFVVQMYKSAEQETSADRARFTTAFDLFAGKMDWGQDRDENEWMSKPFIHEFSVVIRRLADALSNLIFDREDFFTYEPNDKNDDGATKIAEILEKIVYFDLESIRFSSLFYDFCLSGAASGLGILKIGVKPVVTYEAEAVMEEIEKADAKDRKALARDVVNREKLPDSVEELEGTFLTQISGFLEPEGKPKDRKLKPKKRLEIGLCASVVDPRNFAFEPDAAVIQDSEYKIERIDKKLYELHKDFESGYLDKTKREELATKKDASSSVVSVSSYESQKLGTRDQQIQKNLHTPKVELFEYYGPLLGTDGDILQENMHFIVGGGNVLLKARKNPYFSQKDCYICSTFSKSPFKAVGRGVGDNGVDQQRLNNELFGTFIDMLKLSVYSPTVVDDSALRDPEDLDEGIYPGMIIKTFGKKADDVFSKPRYDVATAQVLFQTIEKLSLTAQRGSSVDVSSSNPSSRARITAAEIQSNISRSDDSIVALARELDNIFLKPLINKIVAYRLQFGFELDSLEDLKFNGVINQDDYDLIANIPRIERYNEIKRNYKINVKGFRQRIERQLFIASVNEFFVSISNFPPEILQKLDWGNILSDVAEAYNFSPDRWIVSNTERDTAEEENELLGLDRQIQVLPDDDHGVHLPMHSQGYLRNPTQASLSHITGHIQAIQEQGGQVPELPPEIYQALGIDAEALAVQNSGGEQGLLM